jgi:uncharacterized membrane protein
VPVLKTLHVLGAIFLLGGVSTHALLRRMAEGPCSPAGAAMTIQLVPWLLLAAVVFLMVARPF